MSLRRLRADSGPAYEQQIGRVGLRPVRGSIRDDLGAVRKAVGALERRRPIMHGNIASEGVGVTLRVVGLPEASHRRLPQGPLALGTCRWLPRLTSSRNTLPVMKATFAGRSARRR